MILSVKAPRPSISFPHRAGRDLYHDRFVVKWRGNKLRHNARKDTVIAG